MTEVNGARAHWVAREWIVWPGTDDAAVTFHTADQAFPLTLHGAGVPNDEVRSRFPRLASHPAFRIPDDAARNARAIVSTDLRVSAARSGHVDSTRLQIPGVLDELFRYDGPLGVSFEHGRPVLRLWAPTARNVALILSGARLQMTPDSKTGVWSVAGEPEWRDQFYTYEVDVFSPSTGRFEVNTVTDPYSLSLSTNSRHSQIVDLNDSRFKPDGWDAFPKPDLENPEDIVLYELHIRDFSITDLSVPEEHRGTYLAFTHRESHGMRHLQRLSEAGLTHIHLLPSFDFASVNDVRREHRNPGDLSRFAPDSQEQGAAIARIRDLDGFNWGYDPWHYTTPEGSYSTEPEGPRRIVEFRAMVKSLAEIGLRVVMDVVYNHTSAAGQSEQSVLDRIVPGYFHRLNDAGEVETSSCCPNTATEHAMMEKLMIDSVITWATGYRVDGFRFDLMGHHMKSNMVEVRRRLNELPGGRAIYVYGEGWNFGEVANNARGVNATQANMAQTGIGTFNDRIRDALRGGGPFSGIQERGFATGLADDISQSERLSHFENLIRVSLAGSLRVAAAVEYKGHHAGYTSDPQEAINYASAHDNETLFDAIQMKAPRDLAMTERVRMSNLAVSVVMLAQGIPFFHAGDEILRSKSLDRNSYNSGDWFNRIDWTMESNNFGVGLPPAKENQQHWPVMQPLLADRSLRPSREHMQRSLDHFCEMLRIRRSSALFRLTDSESVMAKVHFLPSERGLIMVMLGDAILIVFNAHGVEKAVTTAFRDFTLHPILQNSTDPLMKEIRIADGTFTVPRRCAAVFLRG